MGKARGGEFTNQRPPLLGGETALAVLGLILFRLIIEVHPIDERMFLGSAYTYIASVEYSVLMNGGTLIRRRYVQY